MYLEQKKPDFKQLISVSVRFLFRFQFEFGGSLVHIFISLSGELFDKANHAAIKNLPGIQITPLVLARLSARLASLRCVYAMQKVPNAYLHALRNSRHEGAKYFNFAYFRQLFLPAAAPFSQPFYHSSYSSWWSSDL